MKISLKKLLSYIAHPQKVSLFFFLRGSIHEDFIFSLNSLPSYHGKNKTLGAGKKILGLAPLRAHGFAPPSRGAVI